MTTDLDERVRTMLADVDLTEAGDDCVDTYSGGMKRRLSLAIAALGSPLCVVLDECTTGLDPVHRRDVWSIIEKLKRVTRCVLFEPICFEHRS